MTRPLYAEIARTCGALENCRESGNLEWLHRYEAWLEYIEKNILARGSGFDSGTKIDRERSHAERVILTTAFHHMDEHGFYDGWTEHEVWATPSFTGGFRMKVKGRNRNGIKEYIGDVFQQDLSTDVSFEWLHFNFDGIPAVGWNEDHLKFEVNIEGTHTYHDTLEQARKHVVDWVEWRMKAPGAFKRREV